MESFFENSTLNIDKQSPILLCQENFSTCEDVVAGSEFLFVADNQIAIDKTLVVHKTVVLKERSVVSRLQNETVIDQPIPPRSSAIISSQNENLIDEMEVSSQTSFMELCSQESAEKMDACSQESVVSKMDLASQENILKVEDRVPINSESLEINEARSAKRNLSLKTDSKRKYSINSPDAKLDDIYYVEDADIMLREEVIGLCASIESLQDHSSADLKNHTFCYDGKNTKRIRK